MAVYEFAPEVEAIGNVFIEQHHRHLLKAKISYVFKDKAWKTVCSRVVLGKAARRTELDQLLSPKKEDFIMLIGKDKWETMDDVDKRSLVDHELCHMGVSISADATTKFVLRPHMIEEFPENLARFERRRLALGNLIQNPPSPIVDKSPARNIVVGDGE
jgi:hypothetical protein